MDRSEDAFRQWAEKHQKSYTDEEERAKRYKIWLDNLEYIEAHNAKGGTSTLALGPHSDLTEEEFKSTMLGFNPGAGNA